MMSWIEDIRRRLGWSQEDMGLYLGLSRSAIALAETNRVGLNTESSLRLNRLRLSTEQPVSIATQQLALQYENTIAHKTIHRYKQRLKQCEDLLEKTLANLETTETKYAQALQCLQWISQERTGNATPAVVLNVLEDAAIATIRQHGRHRQSELQHQLFLLRSEIDALRMWLENP